MRRPWPALGGVWLLAGAAEALRRGDGGLREAVPSIAPLAPIAYMHLTKTGGSFIERVLKDTAGGDKIMLGFKDPLKVQGGYDYLRLEVLLLNKTRAFTIGSIRNPCEWYLSLWAYLAEEGHGRGDPDEIYMAAPMQNMTDDILRFRKFIRYVYEPAAEGIYHDPENWPGLMSTQFAWRYSKDPMAAVYLFKSETRHRHGDLVEYDGYTRPVNNRVKAREVEAFKRSLEGYNLGSVDCWVEMHTLERDLATCLTEAEIRTAVGMNWDKFAESIRSRDHNPSKHGECRQYFDNETERFIRKVDRDIFRLFNYTTCCNPE